MFHVVFQRYYYLTYAANKIQRYFSRDIIELADLIGGITNQTDFSCTVLLNHANVVKLKLLQVAILVCIFFSSLFDQKLCFSSFLYVPCNNITTVPQHPPPCLYSGKSNIGVARSPVRGYHIYLHFKVPLTI